MAHPDTPGGTGRGLSGLQGMTRWFALSVVASFVVVVGSVLALPEGRIALHWGADGQPDRWGSATQAALLLLGVWALFALMMAGFIRWSRTISLILVNVPEKDYWSRPENEPVLRARLREDMAWTGIWMMVVAAYVALMTCLATRNGNSLEAWLIAGIVVLTVLMVLGIWLRTRFYRHHP